MANPTDENALLVPRESLIAKFEIELRDALNALTESGSCTRESAMNITANVMSLLISVNYFFIGDNTAKIITDEEAFRYYIIGSTAVANALETRLTTRSSLGSLFSNDSNRTHVALNVGAGVTALSIAVTYVLLALTGRDDKTITALAIASSLFSVFSSFFGARKLLAGSYQQYVNHVGVFRMDEDGQKLHRLRQALSKKIQQALNNSSLLEEVLTSSKNNDNPQSIFAILFADQNTSGANEVSTTCDITIDAFFVLLMLATVSGYVAKTGTDLYELLHERITPTPAMIIAVFCATATGLGLSGLSVNAGLGIRATTRGLWNGINEGNPKTIISAMLTMLLITLSGSSGFLANHEAWKSLGKTYALVAGYIAFVACGLVNVVYGNQVISSTLDEAASCRKSPEEKMAFRKLDKIKWHLSNLGERIHHASDSDIKELLSSGNVTADMIGKMGLDIHDYWSSSQNFSLPLVN